MQRHSETGNGAAQVVDLFCWATAVGPVDVFVGHSMGGGVGGEAVREGWMRPKLVGGVGSSPQIGANAPPLLLLVGRFDEFFHPDKIKARTDAQSVISPWSNHGTELFDPLLVNAAVKAACAAVGKAPPPAATRWCWRIAGAGLAMLGALGIAVILPPFPLRVSAGQRIPRRHPGGNLATEDQFFLQVAHI